MTRRVFYPILHSVCHTCANCNNSNVCSFCLGKQLLGVWTVRGMRPVWLLSEGTNRVDTDGEHSRLKRTSASKMFYEYDGNSSNSSAASTACSLYLGPSSHPAACTQTATIVPQTITCNLHLRKSIATHVYFFTFYVRLHFHLRLLLILLGFTFVLED